MFSRFTFHYHDRIWNHLYFLRIGFGFCFVFVLIVTVFLYIR